ncbi:MAG: glycosyltransferase family 4 protein [Patescibacteria group bacterium]|nr:glycosyltransferase family 4 protein [Patescibacteria group bacterium]
MKILMLTPYLPYPLLSGGQIRTYNLLKKLAKKHEITLFALIKDYSEQQYVPEIEKYCKKVIVFKRSKQPFTFKNIFKTAFSSYPFLVIRNHVPAAVPAMKQELAEGDYDLIHAETFYMMPHLPQTEIPTMLVEQTIEYLGYESYAQKAPFFIKPLFNLDIKKIKHWEKYYWEKSDKLITMSEGDKAYIQKFVSNPKKIEVVSNGIDGDWFDQVKTNLPKNPTVLYVGTFKWLPNIEAVNFLVKKVWPKIKQQIPQAKLWIVGNAPTEQIKNYDKQDSQITVSGKIADIRTAFKGSHVLTAPVFSGKGTRYKILEAMACGTPIVATPIAIEGLNVQNHKHVLTAKNADEMAQKTIEVISDNTLWQKLSQNGYQFVQKNYDWQLISKKLDKIYQSMG